MLQLLLNVGSISPSICSLLLLVFGLQLAPSAGESGEHLHNAVVNHGNHADATTGEDDVTVPPRTSQHVSYWHSVMKIMVEEFKSTIN